MLTLNLLVALLGNRLLYRLLNWLLNRLIYRRLRLGRRRGCEGSLRLYLLYRLLNRRRLLNRLRLLNMHLGLLSLPCGKIEVLEGFFNNSGLLAKQILDVITAAHSRSGNLLIEQSVSHGGHANSGGGTSVLTEEVRLGTAFRTSLLQRSRQSQRGHAGTLTDEHFDIVAIRDAGVSSLLFEQLATEGRQVEGNRT